MKYTDTSLGPRSTALPCLPRLSKQGPLQPEWSCVSRHLRARVQIPDLLSRSQCCRRWHKCLLAHRCRGFDQCQRRTHRCRATSTRFSQSFALLGAGKWLQRHYRRQCHRLWYEWVSHEEGVGRCHWLGHSRLQGDHKGFGRRRLHVLKSCNNKTIDDTLCSTFRSTVVCRIP